MRSSRLAVVALALACSGAPPDVEGVPCVQPPFPSGDGVTFAPGSILCVDIRIDEDDLAELTAQTRFGGSDADQYSGAVRAIAMSCTEPFPDRFTYFPADIVVDGRHAQRVGIRKKGYTGSVIGAGDRPSFRINTATFVEGQRLGTTERLTLDNNNQDPTRLRACLAWRTFEDAGYPAPRCNLANVSVNGRPLGTYTHVETLKKRFLRRAFENDDGSLYEGTFADFTEAHLASLPDSLGRWEAKTTDTDPSGAGLRRIERALQASDADLESALAEVIDLEAFFRFWALETLVGQDDGYTANTNNFYVYFDPDRGDRAVFVPWGGDSTMQDQTPSWVVSELTRRLSRHPELRERYLDALQVLLDEVWDEERVLRRIQALGALSATAEIRTEAQNEELAALRTWVSERRTVLQALVDRGGERGDTEPGACTGENQPEDFMLLAELTSVGSASCSSAPAPALGPLALLGVLVARRRRRR